MNQKDLVKKFSRLETQRLNGELWIEQYEDLLDVLDSLKTLIREKEATTETYCFLCDLVQYDPEEDETLLGLLMADYNAIESEMMRREEEDDY